MKIPTLVIKGRVGIDRIDDPKYSDYVERAPIIREVKLADAAEVFNRWASLGREITEVAYRDW